MQHRTPWSQFPPSPPPLPHAQRGTPYIITDSALIATTAHHVYLIAAHLQLFLELSKTFGPLIPDVEFVVGTADEPTVLLRNYGGSSSSSNTALPPPILRFCKSDSHGDVLVPDIHFFMRNFTTNLLSKAEAFNRQYPWDKKVPKLFGR